ncbi:MAG: aspartate aminotransferase [Solirubrobacteraceae bacterium]|nr:aspartate aminotransferase [Solirubrobacteraceae bacterium]
MLERAPSPAAGVDRLGTEGAFAVLARAREIERTGRDVVHLEIGEPDFPTPAHVSEAAFAAIRAGETGYCPSAGIPELREAAAAHLSRTRGVPIAPGRVLIANGAKPFLFFGVLATCEPGDEVIYPDPGFPIYESAIRWAGATPVPLALREADDFTFSLDELAARLSPRTKLVILNSPHNPTGGVLSAADLAGAAELLRESAAWVLADEVYSRLLYDRAFASIASQPGLLERTLVLDSFSKTYAMTGWRCGYAAVPERLVEPLTRFLVNSTSCVPPFVQRAAIAALAGPQDGVAAMLAEFRARRDLVVAGLDQLPGVSCRVPHGAFYAFPNVAAVPLGTSELAERLLEEAGVAVLTGTAFGRAAEQHLRLSYATSRDRLVEALERMGAFLARL